MAEDIEQTIIEILSEQLGVDASEITRDTALVADLSMDSLEVIEFTTAVEDRFELPVPDEDVDKLQTVGQVSDYVARRVQAART